MAGVALPGPAVATGRRRARPSRLLGDRVAVVAAVVLGLLVVAAALAPLLAPHDPNDQELTNRFAEMGSPGHLLGTDDYGRDQLSRLLFGARVSLVAALQALVIGVVGGVPLGMLAGYFGRWVDAVISRLFDAVMSVPFLIVALAIVAVLGPGLTNVMIAVGVAFTPQFFRIARASTLTTKEETYIEAATALGGRPRRILWKHLFPAALPPLIVHASFTLGLAVSAEASLSFLGFGVRPPAASWGGMLRGAVTNASRAPHLVYPPGLVIALTVLMFTLLGDGLRRAVGPNRRGGDDA